MIIVERKSPIYYRKGWISMNFRKILTAISVLCITAALLSPVILAVEPSYSVSSDYKDTKYYENLLAYELTGDQVTDVIAIALSQLGYHEGSSEAQKDGLNQSGSRNFTEYNVLYGRLDNGEGNGVSYGYAWCASFVNWCLRQAGVSKELTGGMYVSCHAWRSWFIHSGAKYGASYHDRGGEYTPAPGDLIFYRSLSATHSRSTDHIGIVLRCEGGKVYAIEGNASNRVGLHEYSLDDKYIVGYGTPAYARADVPTVDYYAKGDYQPGYYISGSVKVSAYEKPNMSSEKLASLDTYSVHHVLYVQGDYGLIDLEDGSRAWAMLKSFTPMTAAPYHTVKFVWGENVCEFKAAAARGFEIPDNDVLSSRLGDIGLIRGWTESKSFDILTAGHVLTLNDDLVLYALTEMPKDDATAAETLSTGAPADSTEASIGTGCGGTLSTGAICLILAASALIFARKRSDQ